MQVQRPQVQQEIQENAEIRPEHIDPLIFDESLLPKDQQPALFNNQINASATNSELQPREQQPQPQKFQAIHIDSDFSDVKGFPSLSLGHEESQLSQMQQPTEQQQVQYDYGPVIESGAQVEPQADFESLERLKYPSIASYKEVQAQQAQESEPKSMTYQQWEQKLEELNPRQKIDINVIDNYFEKPKVETASEKSERLKQKMRQTNNEMQRIVDKIEKVAPQIEFDPILVDKKALEELNAKQAAKNVPGDAELKEVNGKQFLVHKVQENDSLMKLSLRYNISTRLIKNCNGLVDDQIYQKRELLIPVVEGMVCSAQKPITEEQEKQRIQLNRDYAVRLMKEHMREKLGNGNYQAEALFYCSENNYEYQKARDAFEADRKFEEEQAKLNKKNKKKGGYNKIKSD